MEVKGQRVLLHSEKELSLTHLPSTLTLYRCPGRGCERWRLALGAAQAPHRPLPLPLPLPQQLLELPLSLQLLAVPLLSNQPSSWGLRLQEQGQGVNTGALGAHF